MFATAIVMLASCPAVQDGLLWRLERLQSSPTLSQRIFERRLVGHHLSLDGRVPPASTLFFGDSHIQALPLGGLPSAYNFAIGGESAQRLALRLSRYTSLPLAGAVVIGTGTNDLFEGRSVAQTLDAWGEILGQLPKATKVVCVEIPVNLAVAHAARHEAFNRQLAQLCLQKGHSVVSSPRGDDTTANIAFSADGVHLNAAGSQWLMERIEERVLKKVP